MKTKILLLIVIPFLATGIQIKAQCIYTFQPGAGNGKDALVWSLPCNSNYAITNNVCNTQTGLPYNQGNSEYSEVAAWTWGGTPAAMRTFLEFNLSSLSSSACTVQKAILFLYHPTNYTSQFHCGSGSTLYPCSANDFLLSRVTQSWTEDSIIWQNQPAVANAVTGQDYVQVADNYDPYLTYEIDITDMVNYWVANPGSNFGMSMALNTESGYRRVAFANSEYPDPSRHPKLVVWTSCDANNSCTNLITGNIFEDLDNSCTKTSGDRNLSGWMVRIEPGPLYAITDSNGYYEAWVDTGEYMVTEIIPTLFWNPACPQSRTVTFTFPYDTSNGNNFANTASQTCSSLWVDIATSRLRPMHDENYVVNYCNLGNAMADSVKIEVEFDSYVVPNYSSPLAPSAQSGNTWVFSIGTLNPGQCGMFYINTTVNTTSAGITQCVQAEIYPNTYCGETIDTSLWDKSSVNVEGECADSMAQFIVCNTGDAGDGDMEGPVNYRIYINDTLFQDGQLQLNGQECDTIRVLACGNTVRLEVDQRPGHPGHSHPKAILEGCGMLCGPLAMGHVNSVSQDDEDIFVETDCHEIITSYDPNEKLVSPQGITSDKYISPNDELEYTICFQNTGQDTAFFIRVLDTIPQDLDITSLKSGASSHLYTLKIYNSNIAEWTFNNINLADSATNEALSHGFVKFKIKQVANNPDGTQIINRGGIFFDYNPAVMTAPVAVEVNTKGSSAGSPVSGINGTEIKVYPNPFANSTTVDISAKAGSVSNLSFIVLDLLGKEVTRINNLSGTFEFTSNELISGLYFYKLYSGKELLGTGKFIIQ